MSKFKRRKQQKQSEQRFIQITMLQQSVPKVECKGLCTDQCTIISMTQVEYDRMTVMGGEPPRFTEKDECNYLHEGRCKVYAVRPLVCRLYGAVDSPLLNCPHGCTVTPEKLSNYKSREILERAIRLSPERSNATTKQFNDFAEREIQRVTGQNVQSTDGQPHSENTSVGQEESRTLPTQTP